VRTVAAGAYDGVDLLCPNNLRAVTGGFESPSPMVVSNGVSPGQYEGSWIIEVVNLTETAQEWRSNVTCI
jgi:hypothetical protein